MRGLLHRLVGLLAIYAIVFQTLAFGTLPAQSASAALDPLSVICLNSGHGTPSGDPAGTPASQQCHHCVLCNAAAAGPAPAATAHLVVFSVRPASGFPAADRSAPRADAFAFIELPRGPPQTL